MEDFITNLLGVDSLSLGAIAGSVVAAFKDGDTKTRVLMGFGAIVAVLIVVSLIRTMFGG